MNTPATLKSYFRSLVVDLTTRGERAAMGLLSLGNNDLRAHFRQLLTQTPGSEGTLLADPAFEPTFGWEEAETTMGALAGGLLHPRLVEVMSKPPKELAAEYTFPSDRKPFVHQMEAWKLLCQGEPRSLVVTSGTGSGKTECFLVPILNSLARAADSEGRLDGVRALFIYPLNALINSQQSRLDAWTDGFGGQLRHCLYTGALENEAKSSQRRYAGQVIDRKSLRASAPPILVTNATMLEYMLVRKDDAPILEQSAGRLQWIVLDEAHTYIGSQAAEMALLLRRVMLAFKVQPKDVRFVATSATFGSDESAIQSLQDFLADMAGVSTSQVHVVHGRREIPPLLDWRLKKAEKTLDEIMALEPSQEQSEKRFACLVEHPTAMKLRSQFVEGTHTNVRTLSQLKRSMDGLSSDEVLQWLDVVSGTKDSAGQSFLPLRAHLFHNVIPTIRGCVDPDCTVKVGTPLNNTDWSYGGVYSDDRTRCDCGAPVLPLVSCNECNAHFLMGSRSRGKLHDPSQDTDDDFALEEPDSEELDVIELDDTTVKFLITNRNFGDLVQDRIGLDRVSLRIGTAICAKGEIPLTIFMLDGHECPECGTKSSAKRLLRFARIGAPFTLSTVISTLLEYFHG